MITELVLTGTGFPRPHPDRAGPGVFVRRGETCLQFDAGRATAMRLAALGVSCRELDAVFVTHHHSDHLTDLADLALTRWIAHDAPVPDSPLPVVAPAGPAVRFAERLLDAWTEDIAVRVAQTGRETRPEIHCVGFEPTREPTTVWSDDEVFVQAVQVHHEPVEPAVAYRVDTPEGAVVISGDTRACDEVRALADGADILVHEVIRASVISATASSGVVDYHAEATALGRLLAPKAVPVLVLTHLIPAPDSAEEEAAYIDEVRAGGYEGEIHVGRDLMRFTLSGPDEEEWSVDAALS